MIIFTKLYPKAMKNKFLCLLLLPFLIACNSANRADGKASKADSFLQITGHYGAIVEELGVVSISTMYDELVSNGEFEGKVVGQIKEVCSKKGCWMTLELPNGVPMRVTFKDYGFFVPLSSQGYPVIIEGLASKSQIDVATLRHYALDAGQSKEEIDAIVTPSIEYSFEAIGVLIKENV